MFFGFLRRCFLRKSGKFRPDLMSFLSKYAQILAFADNSLHGKVQHKVRMVSKAIPNSILDTLQTLMNLKKDWPGIC